MTRSFRGRPAAPDGAQQHRDWLALIDVSGPFLSLPVLRDTWPTLDPVERQQRQRLRQAHADWLADPVAGQRVWLDYVLRDLLDWGSELRETGLDRLAVTVAEHDATITPSFVLLEPGDSSDPGDGSSRMPYGCWAWSVHPAPRRPHGSAATPGRRRPSTGSRTYAATTTSSWAWPPTDAGGRWSGLRVAASRLPRSSTLSPGRRRPNVTCYGRSCRCCAGSGSSACRTVSGSSRCCATAWTTRRTSPRRSAYRSARRSSSWSALSAGPTSGIGNSVGAGCRDVEAHDIYRGAVTVMMRLVFLLFAEERGLLPADNELYATAYSAGGLRAALEQRAIEGTEEDLEHTRLPGIGCSHYSRPCTTALTTPV